MRSSVRQERRRILAVPDDIEVLLGSFQFARNKYETLIKVVEAEFKERDGITVGNSLVKMRAWSGDLYEGIGPEVGERNLPNAIQIMCAETTQILIIVFDCE